MARGRRWLNKPLMGTKIDMSHPLVNGIGMQGFYALNEGNGTIVGDSVRNLNLNTFGFLANNPWATSQYGTVLNCIPGSNTGGSGAYAIMPDNLQSNFPVSFIIGVIFKGPEPTTGSTLCGARYNLSGSVPFAAWGFYTAPSAGSVLVGLEYNSAGTHFSPGFFKVPAFGVPHIIGATITKTSQTAYVDGIPVLQQSSVLSNPLYSPTSFIYIGTDVITTLVNVNGAVLFFLWTNTVISPLVHSIIGSNINNIWQIFKPRISPFIIDQSSNPVTVGGFAYPHHLIGHVLGYNNIY